MVASNELPGVDPEALASLAKQFPRATPTPDPAEAIVMPIPAPVPLPRPQKSSGGGFAIFLALLALAFAAYPVVFPYVKPWLVAEFGSEPVVQFLLRYVPVAASGTASGTAPVVGAKSEVIDALQTRLTVALTKQEANDSALNWAVSGAVGRIAVVENSLATLSSRVDRLSPVASGAKDDVPVAPESMDAWAVSASARIESLEKNLGGTVGRISRLESAFDITQKKLDAVPLAASLPTTARLESIEVSISGAVERLVKVEVGMGGAVSRINELAPAIAAASERVGAVEGKNSAFEGKVAVVEDRITHVLDGRETINHSLNVAQVSLALLQLNTVTQTHKPFAKEIEVARGLAAGDSNILTQLNLIADVAQTGVATTAELRDSFTMIVVPKIRSVSGVDQPLTDRVRSWLSNAIAPTGSGTTLPDKDPTMDIIAAATIKLTEDDVAGAVQQLSQLEGQAATLASRWVAEARARLAIETATDALSKLMLERLSPAAQLQLQQKP